MFPSSASITLRVISLKALNDKPLARFSLGAFPHPCGAARSGQLSEVSYYQSETSDDLSGILAFQGPCIPLGRPEHVPFGLMLCLLSLKAHSKIRLGFHPAIIRCIFMKIQLLR